MKVAVIGSRTFNDYELMCKTLKQMNITEIVSGSAKGADTLAERYAKEHNILTKLFPANWNDMSEPCVVGENKYGKYNKLAGHKRNTLIVEYCDCVVAFHDGISKGTLDSINKTKLMGKNVIIINF